jgi:hypothetical protein
LDLLDPCACLVRMILDPFLALVPLVLLASSQVVVGLAFFLLLDPSYPFEDWVHCLVIPSAHLSSFPYYLVHLT